MYVMCNPKPELREKIINISMTEEELRRMFISTDEFNKFIEHLEEATGIMLPRL